MGDRSSTIRGLARRAFLQLSVAGTGAFGVRELFAAEPQTEVEAALRQPAPARAPGPDLRRAVRRRSAEPHRVPARRPRRRHGLPGGHGRLLARVGAPPARRLQQPADVRRARREGTPGAGPRAGRRRCPSGSCSAAGHRQRRRRHLLRPAAAGRRHLPGALPVRDGGDARSPAAARGHAHRLEPRSSRTIPTDRACRSPASSTASSTAAAPASTPCSRSTPATSWRIRDRPQAVRALDGGFELWGGRRQGQAVGRRQLRRRRRRAGHDGRSRLVPRRLVGSADADVEGGDRRGDGRAAARHRRPAGAGRSLFVPVTLEPGAARTIRVKLAWYVPLSHLRSGKDPAGAADRSRQRPLPRLVRRTLRQPGRARRALARRVRRPARALAALQRVPARHDAAARGDRSGRRQPVDPQVADRAAPGRRAACGRGKAAATPAAAATAPARTSGTTRRRCRTCSRRSSGRCARPSSARRRPRPGTRCSAPRCRSGRSSTTSTPPPTGSSAASSRSTATGASAATPSGCAGCGRRWRRASTTASRPGIRSSTGVLEEPHHNTYDIEFWGPNGMCTSFYLGALQAAVTMGEALGADVGALSRRCWPRARPSPRRISTTASTSSRRSSGKACAPAAPPTPRAWSASTRPKRSRF